MSLKNLLLITNSSRTGEGMIKSQKDAVIEQVLKELPTFIKGKDNALLLLTTNQLNAVKINVAHGILNREISYSKDLNKAAEVHAYARSMVMNHLKKAKELNGGNMQRTIAKSSAGNNSMAPIKIKTPKGVDLTLLSEELKELVLKLV